MMIEMDPEQVVELESERTALSRELTAAHVRIAELEGENADMRTRISNYVATIDRLTDRLDAAED
jgi:hypothetical protein